ncbi:uncharacterized protein LOC143621591 [Bidens hawaiensis]|uniref:uncharacterized protein LOC143621591 n=1 Tax=Bidens hawaiensis TaxID=980011 RepID=UPI004049CE2D
MEVQVISPSPAAGFNFDSTSTTPYATAPSSPQSTIPFTWEEKPGIPKQNEHEYENDSDFAFGYLERHSISAADELFDCGKIKPLKPPPRLHVSNDSHSPKSPKSPKLRLSPRNKHKDFDPFSEALKQTSCEQPQMSQHTQGRDRATNNTRHKVSRSLSPFRISDVLNTRKNGKDEASNLTWYNKWNLKNLLLFRSASEGSATTRKKNQSFSFRSSDGGGPAYKSGLMGCLRFNQNAGSVHEISRGINSVMKR